MAVKPDRVQLLQQIEVDNVPERVPPDAGNSVGVEQQELQRRQSLEDSGRQFGDSVPVQNPVETKEHATHSNTRP
jgi:hypothetical protein